MLDLLLAVLLTLVILTILYASHSGPVAPA